MIQLHATRKLFERLPLNDDGRLAVTPRSQWLFEQAALEGNPLSGWHGNLVTLKRRQCLLMVHEATRFPLVLLGLTKPDFAELNERFVDALMNTLLKCGAEQAQLDAAQAHLRPLQVDAQCNRSAQGTLNRMKGGLEQFLWHDQVNIADVMACRLGAWLANSPCSVKGRGYLFPRKEMLALLTSLPPSLSTRDGSGVVTDGADDLPDNAVSLADFRRRC